MIKELDELFSKQAPFLMREIQHDLDGPYIGHVEIAAWPKESRETGTTFVPTIPPGTGEVGYDMHTYRLKTTVLQSPTICLQDLRSAWEAQDSLKSVRRLFTVNLKWVWKTAFRRDIINMITYRRVARHSPLATVLDDRLPRKVNFFGKEVPAFDFTPIKGKTRISKKYKRSATQYVEFHPDIIHFLFPDPKGWAGDMRWCNIPHLDHNPDGDRGFFRITMTYAARPLCPGLGSVTTVPPPGFIGTLWYWAWKIVGFIP